jgi:hypothetical protein
MRLCLASNLLEHDGFFGFVRAVRREIPDALFLVAGDLLNVFPEPGEDLRGSMFHELFGGDLIVDEMNRLVRTRFAAPEQSRFVEPLRQMFLPAGSRHVEARELAARRYARYFDGLQAALQGGQLMFIPGNMDYPYLAHHHAMLRPGLMPLDGDVVELACVRLAGLGGIPRSAHPFRGVAEISPYEMTDEEYARRLEGLRGVRVLVTHLSPDEHPALDRFVAESDLDLLICRAPFDFRRQSDFRGKLEIEQRRGKTVIKIRPFEHPENVAFVVDLARGTGPDAVETFRWRAE